MSKNETRTPLEQPEGHVGEQVDWIDDEGELESTHILSRDPESTAYLSVFIPGSAEIPHDTAEEELYFSTPSLTVGWETNLGSSDVVKKIHEVLPGEAIKDYCVVPPTEDSRYFVEPGNPYFTSSVDEVLKKERTAVEIYLLDPNVQITWENKPQDELYPLHFAFHTNNSLGMSKELICNLIEHTAAPEKRDAILAAMEPLRAFYSKYVEIDFH